MKVKKILTFIFITILITLLLGTIINGCGIIGGVIGLTTPKLEKLASETINKDSGGVIKADNIAVTIPPQVLGQDANVTISKEVAPPPNLGTDVKTLSPVYHVNADKTIAISSEAKESIKLSFNYDKQQIPADKQTSANVHAMVWNGTEWKPVFGVLNHETGNLDIATLGIDKNTSKEKIMIVNDDKYKMFEPNKISTNKLSLKENNDIYYENDKFRIYYDNDWLNTLISKMFWVKTAKDLAQIVVNGLNKSLTFYVSKEIGFNAPLLAKNSNSQYYIATLLPQTPKNSSSLGDYYQLNINFYQKNIDQYNSEQIENIAAHELFHAIQASYYYEGRMSFKDACNRQHGWLTEGSANAMSGWYSKKEPSVNLLHPHHKLYISLNSIMDGELEYMTHDFWVYAQKSRGNDIIRRVFEKCESLLSSSQQKYPPSKCFLELSDNTLIPTYISTTDLLNEVEYFTKLYIDFTLDRAYKHAYPIGEKDKYDQYTLRNDDLINSDSLNVKSEKLDKNYMLSHLSAKVFSLKPSSYEKNLKITLSAPDYVYWFAYIGKTGFNKTPQDREKIITHSNQTVVVILINTSPTDDTDITLTAQLTNETAVNQANTVEEDTTGTYLSNTTDATSSIIGATVVQPSTSQELKINQLVPSNIGRCENIDVTIKGSNFKSGAKVYLHSTLGDTTTVNATYIDSSNIKFNSLAISWQTAFTTYNVEVVNPDNETNTLKDGFAIYGSVCQKTIVGKPEIKAVKVTNPIDETSQFNVALEGENFVNRSAYRIGPADQFNAIDSIRTPYNSTNNFDKKEVLARYRNTPDLMIHFEASQGKTSAMLPVIPVKITRISLKEMILEGLNVGLLLKNDLTPKIVEYGNVSAQNITPVPNRQDAVKIQFSDILPLGFNILRITTGTAMSENTWNGFEYEVFPEEDGVITKNVEIPGVFQGWINTGIMFYPGDKFTIHADGQIVCGQGYGPYTPEGLNTYWSDTNLLDPTKPLFGLLGKIGNYATFSTNKKTTLSVEKEGYLFMGINDFYSADNLGSFKATLYILRNKAYVPLIQPTPEPICPDNGLYGCVTPDINIKTHVYGRISVEPVVGINEYTRVSVVDREGYISSYNYDFGDGTPIKLSTSPEVFHVYITPGRYKISVVLEGEGGNRTISAYVTVK